jgi:hypothetical protein
MMRPAQVEIEIEKGADLLGVECSARDPTGTRLPNQLRIRSRA